MGANESGTVTAVTTTTKAYCGRYQCYNTPVTTINVVMNNGVARICDAEFVTRDMLVVGQRISLPLAKRVL